MSAIREITNYFEGLATLYCNHSVNECHFIAHGESEFIQKSNQLTAKVLIISSIDFSIKEGNLPNRLKTYSVDFWVLEHIHDNLDFTTLMNVKESTEDTGDKIINQLNSYIQTIWRTHPNANFKNSVIKGFDLSNVKATFSQNYFDNWIGYFYTIQVVTTHNSFNL